jgi:hypothetical protein
MNTKQQLKTIDLNKIMEWGIKYMGNNQEEVIQRILIQESHKYKENEIKQKPIINTNELNILGYKNPKKAVQSLINKGVVKDLGNGLIELVTDKVYCHGCNNMEVYIWDKEDHLNTNHYWNDSVKKHNIGELNFSNKPRPDNIDHDFERIGEVIDNTIQVKCKNCDYKRTIYIDHYRHACNPNDQHIFIENPDDKTDIKIEYKHKEIVFKNHEELDKFIQSKINENNGA